MKINSVLIVSHMYPRDYHPAGGIFVHEQVKALRDAGVDARVITGEPFWINTFHPFKVISALRAWWRMGGYEWELHNDVPVIKFPYIVSSRFLPFQAHFFTYRFGALRCLGKMKRDFSFQIIHAHTSFTDGNAGVAISRKYKVPLVITEHTGPFKVLTRTSFLRKKTQAAINSAGCLIAVSKSLFEDINRQVRLKHPDRAIVLPNVVDVQSFLQKKRKAEGSRINVLWVGHFVPVKRVGLLVKAFCEAVAHEPRLKLTLVGTGPLEAELKALVNELQIAEYVNFAGAADRKQLPGYYGGSDFLVISSESETFGVVAIEAMSCGVPVLSTDCGGPADMIVNSGLGSIVGMGLDDLRDGLLSMAKRSDNFDAHYIRKYAEENFSASVVADRMLEIYKKLQ